MIYFCSKGEIPKSDTAMLNRDEPDSPFAFEIQAFLGVAEPSVNRYSKCNYSVCDY